MELKVESTGTFSKKATFIILKSKIKKLKEEKLLDISKNTNVNGFRKGMIPKSVLLDKFEVNVHKQVMSKVLEDCFVSLINNKNFKFACTPKFEGVADRDESQIDLIFNFETYPKVTIGNFDGLNIFRYIIDVSDNDVNEVIDRMRFKTDCWVDSDSKIKIGDRVNIDFVGIMNNEELKDATANNIDLDIGSDSFIPGFETSLISLKKDDTCVINLMFPENYRVAHLSNKPVKFKVKINSIKQNDIIESNKVISKAVGAKDNTLNSIFNKVLENLNRDALNFTEQKIKRDIVKLLLDENKFEIPGSLISREEQYLISEMNKKNSNTSVPESIKGKIYIESKNRVAIGLIINEIVEKFKIVIDKDLIEKKSIDTYRANCKTDARVNKDNVYKEVKSLMFFDKAINFVESKLTIVEKKITFNDIDKLN